MSLDPEDFADWPDEQPEPLPPARPIVSPSGALFTPLVFAAEDFERWARLAWGKDPKS